MPKKSRRLGRDQSLEARIKVGVTVAAPRINVSHLVNHFDEKHVSVSLRYYQSSCECFSEWEKRELKKFSSTLHKIKGYTVDQLKRTLSLCDMHKGIPAEGRFSLPDDLSPDIQFFELKVDPSNKLRIHGFFVEGVFFLVWLDRKHACFPS